MKDLKKYYKKDISIYRALVRRAQLPLISFFIAAAGDKNLGMFKETLFTLRGLYLVANLIFCFLTVDFLAYLFHKALGIKIKVSPEAETFPPDSTHNFFRNVMFDKVPLDIFEEYRYWNYYKIASRWLRMKDESEMAMEHMESLREDMLVIKLSKL